MRNKHTRFPSLSKAPPPERAWQPAERAGQSAERAATESATSTATIKSCRPCTLICGCTISTTTLTANG